MASRLPSILLLLAAKQGPLTHRAGDRILILTDTNSDGRADSSKVFAQDKDGAQGGFRCGAGAHRHLQEVRSGRPHRRDRQPERCDRLRLQRLVTRRNEPHIGFLLADGPTVSMRDGYGRVLSLAREDVAARVPLKSTLMRDPLALALSEQDIADIAAFLMSR